jgi:hypothetical protein
MITIHIPIASLVNQDMPGTATVHIVDKVDEPKLNDVDKQGISLLFSDPKTEINRLRSEMSQLHSDLTYHGNTLQDFNAGAVDSLDGLNESVAEAVNILTVLRDR